MAGSAEPVGLGTRGAASELLDTKSVAGSPQGERGGLPDLRSRQFDVRVYVWDFRPVRLADIARKAKRRVVEARPWFRVARAPSVTSRPGSATTTFGLNS